LYRLAAVRGPDPHHGDGVDARASHLGERRQTLVVRNMCAATGVQPSATGSASTIKRGSGTKAILEMCTCASKLSRLALPAASHHPCRDQWLSAAKVGAGIERTCLKPAAVLQTTSPLTRQHTAMPCHACTATALAETALTCGARHGVPLNASAAVCAVSCACCVQV